MLFKIACQAGAIRLVNDVEMLVAARTSDIDFAVWRQLLKIEPSIIRKRLPVISFYEYQAFLYVWRLKVKLK